MPQFYVEYSHPAIVSPNIFDMVQREMSRRGSEEKYHSGANCLSGKIICGCCGSAYGSKVWHSNDRYRRVIWQCNHKYKNGEKCTTPHLDEETIKALFIKAANQVLVDREQIIEDCELIRQRLSDTTAQDAESTELHGELQVTAELIRRLVDQNANSALDQTAYQNKYAALATRYQEAADRMKKIEEQCQERKAKGDEINAFIAALMDADSVIMEFDENLWNALVEQVEIRSDEVASFITRDGNRKQICFIC